MTASKKNIEQGLAARARLEAAVLAAGEAGMSPAELVAATGIRGRACNYQCGKSANLVHAKVRAAYQCRWYHAQFADAARAYVEKADAPDRGRTRWSQATQDAVLQLVVDADKTGIDAQTIAARLGKNPENVRALLVSIAIQGLVAWVWKKARKAYFTPANLPPAKPKREVRLPKQPKVRACKTPVRSNVLAAIEAAGAAGISTHELVAQLGLSMGAVNAATNRLCEDGSAKWAYDRAHSRSRPRRYWGAAFDVVKPKPIAGKDLVVRGEAPKKSSKGAWLDSDPIIPAGVRVTRAPVPLPRFYVDAPEPFFSAGKRVEADTWATRAYA